MTSNRGAHTGATEPLQRRIDIVSRSERFALGDDAVGGLRAGEQPRFLRERFALAHRNRGGLSRIVFAQHQIVRAPILLVEIERAVDRNGFGVNRIDESSIGAGPSQLRRNACVEFAQPAAPIAVGVFLETYGHSRAALGSALECPQDQGRPTYTRQPPRSWRSPRPPITAAVVVSASIARAITTEAGDG